MNWKAYRGPLARTRGLSDNLNTVAGAPDIGTVTAMFRTQYIVIQHDGLWKIKFEGKHFGWYHTQRDAVREAIKAAHSVGVGGGRAPRVLVQSTINDQKFYIEWTFGEDPYPPLHS